MTESNPTADFAIDQITEELREIYHADPARAETTMNTYLDFMFRGLSPQEKQNRLSALKNRFRPAMETASQSREEVPAGEDLLSQFIPLVLGHDVSAQALPPSELIKRLGDSLNTIFNALNELVNAINQSITTDDSPDKTIRQLIGCHLGDEQHLQALTEYIGRIKHTFLITQEAYKMSVQAVVDNILNEFDPEKLQAGATGKFGFGAMKKSQYYDLFEKKYDAYRHWVTSGRFMDRFLREFEKNCHNAARQKTVDKAPKGGNTGP